MSNDPGPQFCKPSQGGPTCHIMVGNCSPAVGVQEAAIRQIAAQYGDATITLTSRSYAFFSYPTPEAAQGARAALDGRPCAAAGGRTLVVRFADLRPQKAAPELQLSAVLTAAECGVPGLELHPDFVSEAEEAALLALVDGRPWQALARRRVQHYGFEFVYESRNVDRSAPLKSPIPPEVMPIVQRIEALGGTPMIDQLTVNEYPPGVGIAPHIDTHSAFTGAIVSLSLGGPAVMVLRQGQEQRAVALPRRALLVMGGESRYAWLHYIPSRKSDTVAGEVVPRETRRVSFTFRQIRGFPCDCAYPQHCDSQQGALPPTRMSALRGAGSVHSGSTVSGSGSSEGRLTSGCSSSGSGGGSSGSGGGSGGDGGKVAATCSGGRHWLAPEGVLAAGPQLVPASPATPSDSEGGQAGAAAVERASSPGAGTAAAPGSSTTECGTSSSRSCEGGGSASSSREEGALGLEEVDRQLQQLEERFVHSVYNAIAPHFSATRFAVWPKVRAFIESLPPGSVVADVGCGNGKYFGVRRDVFVLGSDRSEGLARVASQRLQPGPASERLRADVAVADAMCLPYRPACCDGVLCIAVLHHISSARRRLRLLAQLLELLVPGGRALVTVWATEQENMKKVAKWQPIATPGAAPAPAAAAAAAGAAAAGGDAWQEPSGGDGSGSRDSAAGAAAAEGEDAAAPSVPSGDYFVPWHLPFHRLEAAAAAAQVTAPGSGGRDASSDAAARAEAGPALLAGTPQVDSGKGAVVFQRYYHLFERGELDALVAQLPGAQVADSFYDKDNWCVVMERL